MKFALKSCSCFHIFVTFPTNHAPLPLAISLFVLLINNPSELCICVCVCVCYAYVYVMILIFGCSCMHLFALHSLPLLPFPLLVLLLLFTICFLLNCSFVLTCKFLNFHHSFSFTSPTIFAVFCRPPFVACNTSPSSGFVAGFWVSLFTAFVCISKCVKYVPHWEGGNGRGLGEATY